MQQSKVYNLLVSLEVKLEEGFPIIPNLFTVVKTKDIYLIIEQLYAAIPEELQEARKFLREYNEIRSEEDNITPTPAKTNTSQQSIYDLMRELEITIDRGLTIVPGTFTIINSVKASSLIEGIYKAVPEEIQEARVILKQREELRRYTR